jgi:hypothetical protein
LKVFLENVIHDTVTYTEHVKRKIVSPYLVFVPNDSNRPPYPSTAGDSRLASDAGNTIGISTLPGKKKAKLNKTIFTDLVSNRTYRSNTFWY